MLRLCSLFLALVTVVNGDVCDCGTTVRTVKPGQLGFVASPNFPQSYLCGTTTCTWILSAGGPPVTLEFQTDFFDIEPGYDFLEVYDGANRVRKCTGTFCSAVTSSGSSLTLVLTKDDSDVANFRGFYGDFHSAVAPPTTTTAAPRCLCGSSLHVVPKNAAYGTLTSPDFPNDYCANLDCSYQLYSPGARVGVTFPKFDLANDDHVYVYDGRDSNAPILARCSGGNCPNVTGSSDCVTLQFTTNKNIARNGWMALFFASQNFPTTSSSSTSTSTTTTTTTSTTTPTTTTSTTTAPTTLAPGQCQTCYDLRQRGMNDGLYWIRLWDNTTNTRVRVRAYCRAGRTIFLQRVDASVAFNQNWASYKAGFGSVAMNGNYWLGNDALHLLSSNCGPQMLRVDVADCNGNTAYETYSRFQVGDESTNYRLSLGGTVNGTAGDGLNWHSAYMDGMPFSTIDRKNNQERDCSSIYGGGGWWFNNCYYSLLTGIYNSNCPATPDDLHMSWNGWPSSGHNGLLRATMSVYPVYALPEHGSI